MGNEWDTLRLNWNRLKLNRFSEDLVVSDGTKIDLTATYTLTVNGRWRSTLFRKWNKRKLCTPDFVESTGKQIAKESASERKRRRWTRNNGTERDTKNDLVHCSLSLVRSRSHFAKVIYPNGIKMTASMVKCLKFFFHQNEWSRKCFASPHELLCPRFVRWSSFKLN